MANPKKPAPAEDARRLDAYARLGKQRAAARELGISLSTLQNTLKRNGITDAADGDILKMAANIRAAALKARGATVIDTMEAVEITDRYGAEGDLEGFSVRQRAETQAALGGPDKPLPGFLFSTITSLYGRENEKLLQWQQQKPEKVAQYLEVESVIDARVDRIAPLAPVPMPAALGPAAFLNHVTIADGHVGALAWDAETGSGNWDLNMARDTILAGACWLMDTLPPAEDLLLVVLGDFLDSDGYAPLTPASKHLLDVDGRFPKIADVGSDVIEAAVLHGLTRYRSVRLVIKPGNHDPLSAMWMRKMFGRIFRDNPRVIVEPSLRPYWGMLFGKCMITTHHGDKAALNDLPAIFAADFAEMWGKATYRVCHTGHLHHKHIILHTGKELRGMMVYQHPTAAARNAWAADKGLAAARELIGHSYRIGGGMATTLHWQPEMLDAAA